MFAFVGAVVIVTAACSKRSPAEPADAANPTNRLNPALVSQLTGLEARERMLNETVWATEILAQHHGHVFETLWDTVNVASNKLDLLAEFPFGEILLGDWSTTNPLPHGIEVRLARAPGPLLSAEEWKSWVQRFRDDGWYLGELEFRHLRFQTNEGDAPFESTFYFAAQLRNPARQQRTVIEGDLIVHWSPPDPAAQSPVVRRIDATHLALKSRAGDPPFEALALDHLSPPRNSESVDPLMVYDLDHDGFSEIIVAAGNLVFHRQPGSEEYRSQPLCQSPATAIHTAVIADFDGDGNPDFLAAAREGLILFSGSGRITFEQPGRIVFDSPPGWNYPMVLTAGDIDADGDLDLFVGQYRVPYERGSLPTPYYDANDGHPAFLLHNDGRAGFTDATDAANLQAKRWRRTYSASFADLDSDGHLDLIVVSDFAGVDLHRNDGGGRFTDVTASWVPDARAFGMAHAIADFNTDGRPDFLMVGMYSPTVDRLRHLDLWRTDVTEDQSMPGRMMYGNRLYLARASGGFEQSSLSDDVARSGWSWGAAAFDFDNDSSVDLFIANGLESRTSVRDYESEFWLHDRFIAQSQPDPAAYLYFQSKFGRTRGRGYSYGGYERNRFYLNHGCLRFEEIGHLFGLALQEDARHAVADDVDGDGRVDLIATGFETWPASRQILRLFRNVLEPANPWIGFRLQEEPHRLSPVGATISLHTESGSATRMLVTGDSHRSQSSCSIHFGLGHQNRVEQVEIRWPGGKSITVSQPAPNQYHLIRAPIATAER
jgi:hypothetical protein